MGIGQCADVDAFEHDLEATQLDGGSGNDRAGDNQGAFGRQGVESSCQDRVILALGELNLAGRVAQDDEAHALLVANGFGEPMQCHALPDAKGQIGNESAA